MMTYEEAVRELHNLLSEEEEATWLYDDGAYTWRLGNLIDELVDARNGTNDKGRALYTIDGGDIWECTPDGYLSRRVLTRVEIAE